MGKKKTTDSPTYLFWLYELALTQGNSTKAAKLAQELRKKGLFIRRLPMGGAK
jgi:hypothetical protein